MNHCNPRVVCRSQVIFHNKVISPPPGFLACEEFEVMNCRHVVVSLITNTRAVVRYIHVFRGWGGDVAQLVERRTGAPLTQVRFPGCGKRFFSKSQFSVQTF